MRITIEDGEPMGATDASRRMVRSILTVLAIGASVGLTALMPAAVGMTWSAILDVLAGISASTLLALFVLWLAGLVVHTTVLTAALPGLSHRRALLLNLSGSAVSNLLPFGGAAGVGLGYTMARTWQVPPAAFASYTAISNLWNVLGKLVVGTVILCAALALGLPVPTSLHGGLAFGSVAALLAIVGLAAATVCSARASGLVGRALDRILGPPLKRLGRSVDVTGALVELRTTSTAAVSRGWARLTLGVLAYLALQALLMAACLTAVGAHAPLLVIAVGFGIDRLISVLPFTPGGAGLAELGSAAALVALGVDPVAAAAGTLLYRLFTFLLEIPVGGASALVWLGRNRQALRRTAVPA
jgi:putative heme transporter